ncbi:hypothetical protein Undi14_00725 [Undibacterium sp. 14-3-2]|uniref:hypothetical protein n=1 Tax=Undibacterium sp. 14-3-2 TaxID=2800129 RepID=UPI001905E59E|nr:hypothetical protein [Undibacterium sp. 14-3-2]MBK1888538.1 hypothetical protein [Undibacterium sp. 14-3-2]
MSRFQELDDLLSSDEEDYYYQDLFLHAEELVEELGEDDISSLLDAWSERDLSWCDRFSQACVALKQPILLRLIERAIVSSQKISPTLGLMTRLPKQADQSEFYLLLLNYFEKIWHEHPECHRQVQMCAWSCGLSGRLLKRLSYVSWKDAGL